MENPYVDYYINQAGTGISGFVGTRYQRGNGFFGRIFRKIKPALKYITKKGIRAAANIGQDILDGENFTESSKKHFENTARLMAQDGINKLHEIADQKGSGIK